jgi:hypothetical protein
MPFGSVRNVTEPAQKRSGSRGRDRSWPRPGVCVKTTPSRQFDFGLGGIANCWAKAGCFIGGLKAPHVDAGPIPVAAFCAARGLGTFSGNTSGFLTAKSRRTRRRINLPTRFKIQVNAIGREEFDSGGHGVPFKLKPRSWRCAIPL